MAEAISTLSTVHTIATWRTQLTTNARLLTLSTSPDMTFVKSMPAGSQLTLPYKNPTSL